MTRWALNVLAAISQFWNACWGGDRDQSFSSRSYEACALGLWWGRIAVPVVNALMRDPDHCRRAFISDNERTYGHD